MLTYIELKLITQSGRFQTVLFILQNNTAEQPEFDKILPYPLVKYYQ